jgi:Uma2 family endonuclease
MSQAPPAAPTSDRQCLLIPNVDWNTYTKLLRVFAERPGYRLTSDKGDLEIMSPSVDHGNDGYFLGRLVDALTEELALPVRGATPVTLRRRRRQRGIEPDQSFWIANAHRVAGLQRLNLRTDPPPDLAIEVDVSRSSLDRLRIYASLRVPEVWRLDGDLLIFYALTTPGGYSPSGASRSFPGIGPDDLVRFVQMARQAPDHNVVIRQFRSWLRQRLTGGAASQP